MPNPESKPPKHQSQYIILQSSTVAGSIKFKKIVFQRIPTKHKHKNSYPPRLPPFFPISIPYGILGKEPDRQGHALRTNLPTGLIDFIYLTIGMKTAIDENPIALFKIAPVSAFWVEPVMLRIRSL